MPTSPPIKGIMKKKEFDMLESKREAKRRLRKPSPLKIEDLPLHNKGGVVIRPKPKDPLELQIWKLETKLGILQKEFREHNHDEGKI